MGSLIFVGIVLVGAYCIGNDVGKEDYIEYLEGEKDSLCDTLNDYVSLSERMLKLIDKQEKIIKAQNELLGNETKEEGS